MTFDWHEYSALAGCLYNGNLKQASEEARFRSAISRAYYAAYCSARNYIRTNAKRPLARDWDGHRAVSEWFRCQQDPESQQIGQDLLNLLESRNKADYRDALPFPDPRKATFFWVETAQLILQALRNLPKRRP